MSICRALNSNGDWIFGNGISAYLSGNAAIAQDIQTRLLSFVGDCFFDATAGINWWNLLGSKNVTALNLAINSVILNTNNVTGILETSINLTAQRVLSVYYNVITVYSITSGTFEFDLGGVA